MKNLRQIYLSNEIGLETITIQMYISPIFYEDSEILSAVEFKNGKWHSDNNPSRIINSLLSGPGQELENPVEDEYNQFVDDCKFIIKYSGFTIIHSSRSDDSKKPEYVLVFGMNDDPYGKLVFDFRISDHPLESYQFPEEFKQIAMNYLKMNKILDGSAAEEGIDFQIEKVLVGSVKNDTWDRALNRLSKRLDTMRNKVRKAIRNYRMFNENE